jgi:hypothetical protein
MTFDAAQSKVLLFGGSGQGALLADTWTFDGVDWTSVMTASTPIARVYGSMTTDVLRGRTTVFGGLPNTVNFYCVQDQQEFDGVAWTPVTAANTPSGRFEHATVFDQGEQRLLMYGGWEQVMNYSLEETWSFIPAPLPSWTRYGSGCPGSNGTASLDAQAGSLPALGATFLLALTSLPTQPGLAVLLLGNDHLAHWNGRPLPLRLSAYGLLNCQLWIAPQTSISVMHTGGSGTASLAIPSATSLLGTVLTAQALVFDAASQTGIATVSNAGVMRIY